MDWCRNRNRGSRRQIRAAIEGLETRALFCALHVASGPTVAEALAGTSSLSLAGNDLTTLPKVDQLVDMPLSSADTPAAATPGQVNGTTIFGGGIFGAAATTYTARADGLPLLDSKPGAPFSVFIDFDGWTGNGYGGAQTWTPYDTDGNAAVFGTTERANIAEGWRRIAAYMAPFNVNVTTTQPANGNNFSWSVISNSGGGYSWLQLGSFAPSAFNPSGDLLGRTSGVLHELGHNFSLQHQSIYDSIGTKTTEYRSKLDSLHGVVMGVDYDGTPPKWIYGHPANNNVNAQDDVAVIAGKVKAYEPAGGDGMRADDYGNTAATAAPLPAGTGSVVSDGFGIIERLSDADAFQLPATAGWYTIAAIPDSPSALDAKLEIYDSAGNQLAVVDDPASISASVTINLPAGQNYAIVRAHGNYGDLGPYEIKVSTASAVSNPTTNALPAPTNVAAALAANTGVTVTWTAAAGATSYQVERSIDGVTFTTAATVTATTHTDATLNGSARYVYRVRSKDATGISVPSSTVAIINRPSAITGLRTTAIGSTQIVLDWLEVPGSSGETGYRIERGTDGLTYSTVGTVAPNVVIFNNTGLVAGTTYYYRVVPTSTLGDGPATALTVTTRLPAVTGLAFTAKASDSLSLSWTDSANDVGYRLERSLDNATWANLVTLATNVTTYTNTGLTAASEYYYRVSALDAAGVVGVPSSVAFTASPALTPPTTPWTAVDIGGVGGAGTTSFNATTGVYTLLASGTDIWGTSDQFRFTYQPFSGNGSITAKILTQESTAGWAKVGVMFRNSTATGASHAFMLMSPSNGAALQSRSSNNGSSANVNTTSIGGAKPVAPYWVRLTRAGNLFTGYASPDGVTWTQVGTATVTMSTNALVGLAIDSADNAELNTSTIDQVAIVTPNVAPVAVNDSASTLVNTAVTVNVLGNDTDSNNDTLALVSAGTPAHGTAAIVAGGILYTPTANYTGADSFTYSISDGNGGTASASVSITVNPNRAPTIATAAAASATIVTGQSVGLSALGADLDTGESSLAYTWSMSSGPAAVTFSANGTNAAKSTTATFTKPGAYTFQVAIADPGGLTVSSSVSVTVTQNITGIVYQDNNSSGVRDASEALLSGVTVYLDNNNSGTFTAGEPTTTTAANGSYSFSGLTAGTYHVRVTPPAGLIPVTPSTGLIDVSGTLSANFGLFPTTYTAAGDYELQLDATGNNTQVLVGGVLQYSVPRTLPTNFSFSPASGGTGSLTIDLSAGDPIPTGGVALTGSTGTSTLAVLGSASADAFALTASVLTINGKTVTFSNNTSAINLNGNAGNDSLTLNAATSAAVRFNGGLTATDQDLLTINAGTYKLQTDPSTEAAHLTVVNNGTFDLNGFGATIAALAGTGTVTNSSTSAALLSVAGGSTLAGVTNGAGTFAGVIGNGTGVVSLAKTGSGTLTLTGVNTYTGSTSVTGGTMDASAGSIVASVGPMNITNAGSTLIASQVAPASLTVSTGAKLKLTNVDSTTNFAGRSSTGSLSNAGLIDIGATGLIVGPVGGTGGGLTANLIRQQVQSARGAGTWTGTSGLTSSMAAADPVRRSVGFALSNGQWIIAQSILGDANLDGVINIDDLSSLAQNYNGSGKTWQTGDVNYDALVNVDDLSLLAQNYNVTINADSPAAPSLAMSRTIIASVAGLPQLQTTVSKLPAKAKAGATWTVTGTTRNAGSDAGKSVVRFYLSKDKTLSPATDLQVGMETYASLNAGQVVRRVTNLRTPKGLTPGKYFLIAMADQPGAPLGTIQIV